MSSEYIIYVELFNTFFDAELND